MKSRISKLLQSKILFIFLFILISIFSTHFFMWADDEKEQKTIIDFMLLRENQVRTLINKLSDKKIWEDKKRNEEIVEYLETARLLNAYELAPILAQHIFFIKKDAFIPGKLRFMEPMFPSHEALKSFGPYSIPFLIHNIKKLDANIKNNKFVRYYSLICIIAIYHKGGFGNELTQKRLELELRQTKDKKERANLEAALKNNVFKTKNIEPDSIAVLKELIEAEKKNKKNEKNKK